MGKEWLAGVYRGELVTAGKEYVEDFWKNLGTFRESPFLETHHLRAFLVPHFFFIEPVPELKQLGPSSFKPSDWGLSSMAYAAIEGDLPANGKMERGGLRIAAKGRAEGDCFVIDDVPDRLLKALEARTERLCVLATIDRSYGTARTGTFFKYRPEGSRLRLRPIMRGGKYLVGKGILVGALPELLYKWTGGMNAAEYEKEKHCPLTIGGALFKKQRPGVEDSPLQKAGYSVFKGSGMYFYIAYRGVETDLRIDMPAVLLYLKDAKGLKLLARNMGASLERVADHIAGIAMRNVLADGHIVDYADIDLTKSLPFGEDKDGGPDARVKDAFTILYLLAAVSRYGAAGMRKLFAGTQMTKQEREEIARAYSTLLEEFLKGMGKRNLERFSVLRNPDLLLPYFA